MVACREQATSEAVEHTKNQRVGGREGGRGHIEWGGVTRKVTRCCLLESSAIDNRDAFTGRGLNQEGGRRPLVALHLLLPASRDRLTSLTHQAGQSRLFYARALGSRPVNPRAVACPNQDLVGD